MNFLVDTFITTGALILVHCFDINRYQVRKLKGLFQRAYGIQAGAALVKVRYR